MKFILFLLLLIFGATASAQEATEKAADVPAEATTEIEKKESADADQPPAAEDAKSEDAKSEDAKAEDAKAEEKPLPAVKVPEGDEAALQDAQEAISALQNGQWAALAALLVGLLLFLYNRFSKSAAPKEEAAPQPAVESPAPEKPAPESPAPESEE